jgi:hypothetical protein
MNKNNLNWKDLNKPQSFLFRLIQDIKDSYRKKATALDWIILWICLIIGISIHFIQK